MNSSFEYTKIRENVWQIAEDNSVCCTLIQGEKFAILVDTGYGFRNLRAFVEENVKTEYMVINSHGHPDHIGGNHWFEKVYAVKDEWDVISYFEKSCSIVKGEVRPYQLCEIKIGQEIDLGGVVCKIVSLKGHTKASIGVLLKEEKLLVSGDAMNEGLWLFNYGALSMQELHDSLKEVMNLEFDTYLCGHSHQEYKKSKITAHIEHIENLTIDEKSLCDTIGFKTYVSDYENAEGKSTLVFTKEVLK